MAFHTRLRPGYVVVLREACVTGPGRGWPAGTNGRVVGPGSGPGEVLVELIGVGSARMVYSWAGSGERVSLRRDAVRRVHPPSLAPLRRFD